MVAMRWSAEETSTLATGLLVDHVEDDSVDVFDDNLRGVGGGGRLALDLLDSVLQILLAESRKSLLLGDGGWAA